MIESGLVYQLQRAVTEILETNLNHQVQPNEVLVNVTSKNFEGDYTIVIFPYVKALRMSPADIGERLGKALQEKLDYIVSFNLVKGFLNVEISDKEWQSQLNTIFKAKDTFGKHTSTGKKVMVEFSSPNTNKPLHLGHIRNILLGWSMSQILEEAGNEVVKTQIVNDRGIAVCKSMMAWSNYGNGETPTSSGIKGDHFVGKYYVIFNQKLKEEYTNWQQSADAKAVFEEKGKEGQSEVDFFNHYKNDYFNIHSTIGKETKEMLIKWEDNDKGVKDLWHKMNSWVYEGFEQTYKDLEVHFDKLYYESDTYLLGKEVVEQGLSSSLFYKEPDGSIWVDLEDVGLDKKLILRSDGTSVYITQDIGTAQMRHADFKMDSMVYVVGNEQDYHFKALFETLKKLGEPYASDLFHLSYGMVDLPTGKMKSREGTVVDADDLVKEVIDEARSAAKENGSLDDIPVNEQEEIFKRIGLAALKYFMIKINPKKRMTFDPKESVDMQGQTGPYIQNAYVRIASILRKASSLEKVDYSTYKSIEEAEKNLIIDILDYPYIILDSAKNYDPSSVANYAYNVAKDFHRFYHDVRILTAETDEAKAFRLTLIESVSAILERSMNLLGIQMPSRM